MDVQATIRASRSEVVAIITANGRVDGVVQITRLSEFVSTVAILTQEAAHLANALGPRTGARATQAAQLANDAVAQLQDVVKRGGNADEAVTTAIWSMSLAALAITEAKANAHASVPVVAPPA